MGGLFTTYSFLKSDGIFTPFGINSPSLLWNNNELLDQFNTKIENKNRWNLPPTKVFISIGGLEAPKMVLAMVNLSRNLAAFEYDRIDLEWYIFDEETHLSVESANMSRSLSVLCKMEKNRSKLTRLK